MSEDKENTQQDTSDLVPKSIGVLQRYILSEIPIIGPALASGFDSYSSTVRQLRAKEFIDRIHERLKLIETKLEEMDKNYLQSEDFQELFRDAIEQYMKTRESSKHEFLLGLVVNSMKNPSDYLERDFFLRKINDLSALHLELLLFYANPKKAFSLKGKSIDNIRNLPLRRLIGEYLKDIGEDVWKAAHDDLHNANLVSMSTHDFGVMTAASGLERANGMLTPLGKSFAEKCLDLEKEHR